MEGNDYYGIYQPGQELTPSTSPSTSFFDNPAGNGLASDTSLVDSGISITDIKKTENNTMSFRVQRNETNRGPVITKTELFCDDFYGTFVRVTFDQAVNVVGKQSAAIYDRKGEGYDTKEKWCDITDIRRSAGDYYNPRQNALFFILENGAFRYTDGYLCISNGLIGSAAGIQAGELHALITGKPEGAAELTASVPGGIYGGSFELTLSGAPLGSCIYYTTDGTEPASDSKEYDGSVRIEQNTELKAIAIDENGNVTSGRLHESYVIEKVSVSRDQVTLDEGETFRLTGVLETPSDTTRSGVFESSDPSVVYTSRDGRLLARKEGQARITFSTENAKAECLVTVKRGVAKAVTDALEAEYGSSWGTWMNALCDELNGEQTLEEFAESGGLSSFRIWRIPDQTYSGASLKPEITVYEGVRALTGGEDFTVSYTKNKNAGTALAKVKFKGSYKKQPSISREFTIRQAALGKDVAVLPLGVKYSGKGQKPKPILVHNRTGAKVALSASEFTVSYQSAAGETLPSVKDEGSYRVVVTSKGKNYSGSRSQTLTVQKTDVVEKLTVKLKKTTFPVSEAPIELVYGRDYTITTPKGYDPVADENGNLVRLRAGIYNNTGKGKGVLIIRPVEGAGYAGSKTVYFTIK